MPRNQAGMIVVPLLSRAVEQSVRHRNVDSTRVTPLQASQVRVGVTFHTSVSEREQSSFFVPCFSIFERVSKWNRRALAVRTLVGVLASSLM